MKFSTIASSALLCAEVAFAARGTARRFERHAKRALAHKSHPKMDSTTAASNHKSHPKMDSTTAASNRNTAKYADYSQNWAGAVYVGSGITSVTGTIIVPTPKSSGSDGVRSCASAWVGIDGETCNSAILQTGVLFCVEGGEVSFDTWYEWYPDYSYDFDLEVSSGDSITMTVTATSSSSGTAVITNNTSGKSVSHTFTTVMGDLCKENAEWIVEDFQVDGELVPFADFDEVEFTGATAEVDGSTINAGDYTKIFDIEQDSVLTNCSASGTTVTCSYV